MSKKLYMTNADYVAIAISPALIMALVGSLVYFLIEVMYVGDYQARLNYAFGLFVFAAVLIARISIEFGAEHATLYALPLGIAMFLFLVRFVEQPSAFSHVINLGLMGLVWWCAHKLTWDSTVIDDAEDASGEGLMQRIGVDDGPSTESAAVGATDNELLANADQPASAAQRLWRAFVRPRKGPHTPGMWVLYFSLAALPLFGIGQHWIPAAQVGRRRYAFTLLLVYVASALALLVTTSFLNLRRYLRQRRVEMPPVIAGTWVGVGAVLIVIVMMVAALIPRPGAEVAISQVPWQAGSPGGMSPSRFAMNRDGGEEQKGGQNATAGEKTHVELSAEGQPAGQPVDSQQQSSGQSGNSSQKGESQGKSQHQGGKKQGSQQQGRQQSGEQQDGQPSSDAAQQVQSGSQPDQAKNDGNTTNQGKAERKQNKSDSDKGGDKSGQSTEGGAKGKSEGKQSNTDQQQSPTESNPSASPPREEQQEQPSEGQSSSSSPTSQITDKLQNVTSMLGGLTGLLKILLYIVLALALGYALWKYRRELMQALAEILRSLRELFGGKRPVEVTEEQAAAQAKRARTFAEFRDPFQSGDHRQMPPEELVRYTFAAFEAWANDRGKPRAQDCTPQEFVRITLPPDSEMHAEARRLARLYNEAAYAGARTPREAANNLLVLWQQMRAARTNEVARTA